MNERVILGLDTCPACGAVVELRLTKTSKAYYICDGTADEKACSFRGTYGERHSRKLRAGRDGESESKNPSEKGEGKEVEDAGGKRSDDGAGGAGPGSGPAADGKGGKRRGRRGKQWFEGGE